MNSNCFATFFSSFLIKSVQISNCTLFEYIFFIDVVFHTPQCSLSDHGSPDPWTHTAQLAGSGSPYSGSGSSYTNSYGMHREGMHPRESMVGLAENLFLRISSRQVYYWQS